MYFGVHDINNAQLFELFFFIGKVNNFENKMIGSFKAAPVLKDL